MIFFDYIKNDSFFKQFTLKSFGQKKREKEIDFLNVKLLNDNSDYARILRYAEWMELLSREKPYQRAIEYMKEHKVKLEQEIISYYMQRK